MAVCGLAFFIYSRSLFCGFVRDDIPQIVHNWQVHSWEYLPRLLGSHLWSQVGRDETMLFYRPLFSVWMLLMHTFGGLAPWFWHLSNILLHVAATYLVFRLCQRLTGSDIGAVAAAAIFAVHPIHVDAVTWVSASCEVLFTIFALAAMLALLDSDKNAQPRGWAGALWYGAGVFAKETGIAMLAVLAVFAWVQLKGRVAWEKWFWKTAYPYGAVTAGYLLTRWAVMHRVGVETGEHSWAEVIFSSPSILLFYLKKLFLPWNLSGCYLNPLTASPTIGFWLELTAVLIGLAAIAWFAIRHSSLLGLAAALIVIPVLPALAVTRIYPQGDMTHDRYLYLPSVGLSLLVAMLVKQIWPLPKPAKVAVIAAAIAVLTAFSVETIFQQRYYQDDVAFYSRVIEVSPSAAFARGMLGNVYLDQDRFDLALEQFHKANQTDPSNQKVTLFLARGLFVAGKYHESESVLSGLLQNPGLNPRRRKATLLSLANVQIAMGNLDYAQQLLWQVEQTDDRFPELHWAWGVLYQKQGLLPQAFAEYEKEFQITGDALAQQRSVTVARLIYSQSAAHPPSPYSIPAIR
jgi:predicted negative regulator of RcsB-dependent stress response